MRFHVLPTKVWYDTFPFHFSVGFSSHGQGFYRWSNIIYFPARISHRPFSRFSLGNKSCCFEDIANLSAAWKRIFRHICLTLFPDPKIARYCRPVNLPRVTFLLKPKTEWAASSSYLFAANKPFIFCSRARHITRYATFFCMQRVAHSL